MVNSFFMGKYPKSFFLIAVSMILPGCMGIPNGISPVTGFDLDRYLGTWYEIVRLDHSFERGLINVTASYSLRGDGGIRVINRGYNPKTQKWKQAEGKAYFAKDPTVGKLKVSFWGPFYGAYNIIDLDYDNYTYAVICGPNPSYFWILCRKPHMPSLLKRRLIDKAAHMGFDAREFIHVRHDTNDALKIQQEGARFEG